jgi:hypothetical protein
MCPASPQETCQCFMLGLVSLVERAFKSGCKPTVSAFSD